MDFRDRIICDVSGKTCHDISLKIIKKLQSADCKLSDENSGLENIWEDVCVQAQYKHSSYWWVYIVTIKKLILFDVNKLEKFIKQSIWLTTEKGTYWQYHFGYEDEIIFDDNEIIDYILNEFILETARKWTNKNIEHYISRYDNC